MDVLQSSLLQVSLLHLLLPVLHVQIRRHSRGFACHLSLALPHLATTDSPLQDRRRPSDASSDLSRRSRLSEERFRERFATSDKPSDSRRFASRDSPSPKRRRFASKDSLSPKRQGFASRDSPSPKRQRFASRDSPLQSDSDSLQGTPLLQSDGDSLQEILIHLSVSTHLVPRLVMVLLKGPHRGLLLPVHLHLLGRIRKLMNLLFRPQFEL